MLGVRSALSWVLILVVMPLAVSAQTYTVTDLGTLGGYYSGATGINTLGQVVGYSDTADHSAVHAFLWTRTDGMIDLNPPEISQSFGTAINDFGHVVGVAPFPVGEFTQSHAFLWTKNAGMQDLGTLGAFSTAFGVNVLDQVVGDTSVTGGNTDAAFLWTKTGEMRDLGTLGGGGAAAQAINSFGRVVGGSFTGDAFHAFSWTKSGGMQDLGTLGGCMSQATSVNDGGKIVGGSNLEGCDGTNLHAFLWTKKTGLRDLGAPPNASFGGSAWINSFGAVVGSACLQPCRSQEDVHGFLWTESAGWQDLNTLIPEDSGWVIENVSGINRWGLITGQGLINGEYHAFLLTPTSPSRHR